MPYRVGSYRVPNLWNTQGGEKGKEANGGRPSGTFKGAAL